ncbi:MAG: hypothetical protein IKU07_05965 [Oscillospiraceae bacterium]|nr:hypothetical protein [Oscillospiraceae bacterium]
MKKLFEKLEAFLDKIPPKVQVAINVLLILVMPVLIYMFMGAPVLNAEHGFRRAEKENLVGPGVILGSEEISGAFADTLLVGETESGVLLYTHNHDELNPLDPLTYWERRGDIMVCGIYTILSSITPPDGDDLQLVVFDNHPEAVRATVEAELFWENAETGKQYRYRYDFSGERKNSGYILVTHDLQWSSYQGNNPELPENAAIHAFTSYAGSEGYRAPAGEFLATVRLYAADGSLVAEETVPMFPTETENASS